jgi:hypothetical protein
MPQAVIFRALALKTATHQSQTIMTKIVSEDKDELPDATLRKLQELRRKLLHLHKTLLEMERADFEARFGRVTSGELLQLLLNHAEFAWLRLISALVVQIDEMLSAEEPVTMDDVEDLLAQARLLLASPADEAFREKYQDALQREPAVVMAHSEVTDLLRKEG